MALWTPYAQEAALDLSMSRVRAERPPLPTSSVPQSPHISEIYSTYTTDSEFYATYPYQPVTRYAAHSSISPESSGCWSHILSNAHNLAQPGCDSESLSEDLEYQAFESDALRAMAEKNGGTLLGNNPRMRRAVQTNPTADESYKIQRERNNYAAKQSRDRRKLRELRLAFQVSYLKKKMAELRTRLAAGVCGHCGHICEC